MKNWLKDNWAFMIVTSLLLIIFSQKSQIEDKKKEIVSAQQKAELYKNHLMALYTAVDLASQHLAEMKLVPSNDGPIVSVTDEHQKRMIQFIALSNGRVRIDIVAGTPLMPIVARSEWIEKRPLPTWVWAMETSN